MIIRKHGITSARNLTESYCLILLNINILGTKTRLYCGHVLSSSWSDIEIYQMFVTLYDLPFGFQRIRKLHQRSPSIKIQSLFSKRPPFHSMLHREVAGLDQPEEASL